MQGFEATEPSQTFATAAVQQYLAFCDVYCPFLDRGEILQRLNACMPSDATASPSFRRPEDKVLLNLAVATGTFMLSGYRRGENASAGLVEKARKAIRQLTREGTGATQVQCILALAVLSIYSDDGGSPWHLAGLAISRCFSLGLHTDKSISNNVEETRTQLNDRVFCSAYILDTYVAAGLTTLLLE